MKLISNKDHSFSIEDNGATHKGNYAVGKNFVDIHYKGKHFRFSQKKNTRSQSHEEGGSLEAPMPGKILKVLVQTGEKVESGQTLIVLEAMKMEHKISSPQAGLVKNVLYQEGDRVSQGDQLIELLSE